MYVRSCRRAAAWNNALRERHAEFHASLVQQFLPYTLGQLLVETLPIRMQALRDVEANYDNVRAMLSWWRESARPRRAIGVAIRLAGIWEVRGLYAEARRVLAALLDLAGQLARCGSPYH
jgi:hypothetical protein